MHATLSPLILALLPPHGQCYLWDPTLVWLHAVSDGLIALAYFAISITLAYLVQRRPDLPFPRVFLMFGAFIVACGVTHILEVVSIWHSIYYISGATKAVTAVISLASAALLFRAIPYATQIAGPEQLKTLNASLEARVAQRTQDLATANEALRGEIAEREKTELEKQRLNALLQRRVNELQALFDALPVGVGIAEDAECKVVRSNNTLAHLLGIPTDSNASLSAPTGQAPTNFTVWHDGQEVGPDELPMQICARQGRAVHNFHETVQRADGTRIDLVANAVPLLDEQGQPSGCIATFHDVTEITTAHMATERLAAIVAWSDDAIIGKDLSGIVTQWNHGAEKIFGYTSVEMIGQSITRIIPESTRAHASAILAQIARGDHVPPFEAVRRHKDGHSIDVSIVISPIRDASGHIIGASKLARDITERKAADARSRDMDQKLQETQKLESLGVLAGGIAHDFNNLLTGILGNASFVRTELSASSAVLPFIDHITSAARRAADLCHQMLAYSGRGRFVIASLDLNHVVEETTHLLSVSISKNCVLRFNLAATLPTVAADATQIRQIIMNLVINASEAIGARSGVIALTTGVARVDEDYRKTLRHYEDLPLGDYAFIEVSDNGCGMDAETIQRIFDPFFTTKFTGRGLGLAAVLGIVRGHKGAMKVYSEPARGTTFKLFLPCEDVSPESVLARTSPSKPLTSDRPLTGHVLVVDDEETVRSLTARALERLGFHVDTAGDGREAVEMFRQDPSRYRLVLVDLTMPHLDGEETFRQLRHLAPGLPVVLMSGFNEGEAVGRFAGKGLAGFVQKPFEIQALLDAVRQAVLAN